MTLLEAIKERHSVRHYISKPLTQDRMVGKAR